MANALLQALQRQQHEQMTHQPLQLPPDLLGALSNAESKLYDKSLIYKSLKDAVTAPYRAYSGEMMKPWADEDGNIHYPGDNEIMPEAMNIAGMVGLGGMPVPVKAGPGTLGMFIGRKAKTWNAANNAKALEMEAAGIDPRKIWGDTANWKGPDGHWRQEIPDNVSKWVEDIDIAPDVLENSLMHKQIFSAYPDTANIRRDFTSGITQEKGSFNPQTNKLAIDPRLSDKEHLSTSLHELQHAIQQREGWARGGSPEGMFKEHQSVFAGTDLEGKSPVKGQNLSDYLTDRYRLLAGEAEARATQARMNMDMTQRIQTYPADSYDVPMDQLIVRHGDGPAMSIDKQQFMDEYINKIRQISPQQPERWYQTQADRNYEMAMAREAKNAPSRPRNALGQEIPPTQYELAHAEAQRVAALPVEQGGLGLPVGNTAMERARAMGFDTDVYRGMGKEYSPDRPWEGRVNDPSMSTQLTTEDGIPVRSALFTSTSPEIANGYAYEPLSNFTEMVPDAQIAPLVINKGKTAWSDAKGKHWSEMFGKGGIEANARAARNAGFDSYHIKNVVDQGQGEGLSADTIGMINPKNIRSRFAAFNPAKRDSADLLATLAPYAVAAPFAASNLYDYWNGQ